MPLTRRELDAQLPALLPALQRFAVGLAGSREGGEDLAQEAVLRAMRHHASVRDPKKLLPWLKSIIRNEHRNRRRRERHRPLDFTPEHTGRETWESAAQLMEAIQQSVAAVGGNAPNQRFLLSLVAHSVLGWTRTEVAVLLNERANTVQRRLQELRKRLTRPASRAADPVLLRGVLCVIPVVLLRAAAYPLHGSHYRNRRLVTDAVEYCRELVRRYPEDWLALRNAAMTMFVAAQYGEYENDAVPDRFIREWKRELWDPALLAEAAAMARRLERVESPDSARQMMAFLREFYLPARHALVNWQRCLEACRLRDDKLGIALCLQETQGPAAAISYLKGWARHPALRNDRQVPLFLGSLCQTNGQWLQAVRYFRRFLRWPLNPATREAVLRRIRDCELHRARARQ